MEFDEIRIRVVKTGSERYFVLANGPCVGTNPLLASAAGIAVLERPAQEYAAELDRLLARTFQTGPTGERARSGGRRDDEVPPREALRDLGIEIFRTLLPDAVVAGLRECHTRALARGALRVRFDVPSELAGLPLEAMSAERNDKLGVLLENPTVSLARSLPGLPATSLSRAELRTLEPDDGPAPLHIVVAVASPTDQPQIDASVLLSGLSDAVEPWMQFEHVVVHDATHHRAGPTLGAIEETLRTRVANEPCLLVLVSHGHYDERLRQGFVLLEGPDRATQRVSGEQLAAAVASGRGLRLVVLNTCQGSRGSILDHFSGVAQGLIRSGVPAVVAMQAEVSAAAAAGFTPELVKQVCGNRWIDEAVIKARQRLMGVAVEWCTPTLFIHENLGQGLLFKLPAFGPDPLVSDHKNFTRIKRVAGHVSSEQMRQALWYGRSRHLWTEVRAIVDFTVATRSRAVQGLGDELALAKAEAVMESALEQVKDLCHAIAQGGGEVVPDDTTAAQVKGAVARLPKLEEQVAECLREEANEAIWLAERYGRARASERAARWPAALASYDALLERRRSYADATERRQAVLTEQRLADGYDAVVRDWSAQRWSDAAAACRAILATRPGYKDAQAMLQYLEARERVAAEDWPTAAEILGRIADDWRDGEARAIRAYVQGRLAERAEEWQAARDAYAAAGSVIADVTMRRTYTQARALEQAARWADAGEAYARVPGDSYPDVPQRRVHALGRAEMANGRWPEALEFLTRLLPDFAFRDELVTETCTHLYDVGRGHEKGNRWAAAHAVFERIPGEFRDATARARYAAGRQAERDGRWPAALAAYRALPADYADLARRVGYVEGRLAEDEGRWSDAARTLETLPIDHEDTRDRLPYVQARVAEQAGDWDNVVLCFGRLPDDYRDGDVRLRRGFARACAAAGRGDWLDAIEWLQSLPADGLDGEVGRTRQYARGRVAESRRMWQDAATAYSLVSAERPVLPDCRDVGDRLAYVRGRVAEEREDWGNAAAVYDTLPPSCADVAIRHAYVTARSAELRGDWTAAVGAYEAIADPDLDTRRRAAYARARLAEAREDWPAIEGALGALADELRDVGVLRAYARARLAETAGDWGRASVAFAESGGYRDADVGHAYAEGRVAEAAGRWRRAVAAYRNAGGRSDAQERLDRLHALLEVVPSLDVLADARMVPDPWAMTVRHHPYAALAAAGITPTSSAAQVRDAAFVLMELGAMSAEARTAWDRLRSLPARLHIDAFLYRLQDGEALRQLMSRLEPGPAVDLRRRLVEELAADAGLMLLLDRGREEALDVWETRLRRDPCDVPTAHALAIAHWWLAHEMDARGAWEHAEAAWERAIAAWAFVLSDDGYWVSFQREREATYRQAVTAGDIARLRSEMTQRLLDDMAARADGYAAQGSPRRAEKYRDLGMMLEVELEGARALKEVGGLPPGESRASRLACGPLYARHAGVETAVGRFVASLQQDAGEARADEDVHTALDSALRLDRTGRDSIATPAMLRHLRRTFSALAKPALFLEHQSPELTLQSLPAIYRTKPAELPADCGGPVGPLADDHLQVCQHCRQFRRHDPGYLFLPHRYAYLLQDAVDLGTRAYLGLAQMALTGSVIDLERVMAHWTAAVEVARNAGTQVRTRQAIVRVILGRCDALANERGRRRGERLTIAIDLIERGRRLAGAADAGQLAARESELLTARGVWYGYWCHEYEDTDYDKAARDLRRALELNPESLNARDNLARALIFDAVNRWHAGERQRSLDLASEAIAILHEGLKRTRGHRQLIGMLVQTLDHLEELTLHDASLLELDRRLEELDRRRRESPGDRPGPISPEDTVAAALEKLAAGDVSGAVGSLIRAVRASPDDDGAREMLLHALRRRGARHR